MPGDVIELEGGGRDLVLAVVRMREAGFDFALVGGLAVMLRLDEAHRVTLDLDGVFDNLTDVPTTEQLVTAGVASDDNAPQRVLVEGTKVDVIDTFELPVDLEELPDDANNRLFVCAHRYAFDSAQPLFVRAEGKTVDVGVATTPAIVATKAHALRFATNQRRATKRTSDLFDLYRLAAVNGDEIVEGLAAAPWELQAQVGEALNYDLRNVEQDAALMRSVRGAGTVDHDDYVDVIGELLSRLPGSS